MSENVRNFCIVAHVDHGKSTLADRIIEYCSEGDSTFENTCVLDTMEIERARGITIKAQCVTLQYKSNGIAYTLNMIDTPGHADFFYEVAHALSVCDGVVLLVDATQGVEAQTVANYNIIKDKPIVIIPTLNKIDVSNIDIENKVTELQNLGNFQKESVLLLSAKKGLGIEKLVETIVAKVNSPKKSNSAFLSCLIIDSWYDQYFGVIALINVKTGCVRKKDNIFVMEAGISCKAEAVGIFTPRKLFREQLTEGDVGFVVLGIKDATSIKVGDTITHCDLKLRAKKPLPGFRLLNPVVFSEIYPVVASDYVVLKKAVEKLSLNDSFTYHGTKADIFGVGFSCGYFGMLHMDIVKERLQKEFNVGVVSINLSVAFEVLLRHTKEIVYVSRPEQLKNIENILEIREPVCIVLVKTTKVYVGNVFKLCTERRGKQISIDYFGSNDVVVQYRIPLQEIVLGFGDSLKTVSRGYASFTYRIDAYEPAKVVKVDVFVNNCMVGGLSSFVHVSMVNKHCTFILEKMTEVIRRQQFDIKVHLTADGKIVSKKVVKSVRKNVLDKCYGGDRTRKDKLLKKQKLGKKKLSKQGAVHINRDSLVSMFV